MTPNTTDPLEEILDDHALAYAIATMGFIIDILTEEERDKEFHHSDLKSKAALQAHIDQKVLERTDTVNRFEVINHLSDGSGREVVVWKGKSFKVEYSLQDDGQTLKVFLTDIEQLTKEMQDNE